ncbi:NAD-binding protein [bacterium]|nr:NAD-binding protein [bacterium]
MLRPVFGRSHWQLALALILAVVFSGVIGYRLLVPEFSFIDALYQTMVTLTTVGYNDQADQMTGHDPGVKLFTLGILMFGVFAVTYAFSILMRALIEGELREAIGNRRTRRRVRFMKHHYIVCGCGRMGGLIARRLHEDGKAVVVIDIDSKKKSQLDEEGIVCVIGDATTDEVLREAAIDQARGLIAVTDSDPENLFITMSARQLNPNMTIVSRALTDEAERKLLRAGASRVILPYKIGAHQLVQAALRLQVAGTAPGFFMRTGWKLRISREES